LVLRQSVSLASFVHSAKLFFSSMSAPSATAAASDAAGGNDNAAAGNINPSAPFAAANPAATAVAAVGAASAAASASSSAASKGDDMITDELKSRVSGFESNWPHGPTTSFDDMPLKLELKQGLAALHFEKPACIQQLG
jgi:hypothetical protein